MILKHNPLWRIIIWGCLAMPASALWAQPANLVKIVKQGVAYHNQGEYRKAISVYKKALAIDSASTLANYEIAYSYLAIKKYDSVKIHSQKAMISGSEEYLPAILIYGTALDNTGHPDEAIKLYKKTLKTYPNNYLLHYNLSISYSRIPLYSRAQKQIELAIRSNLGHGGSHLLLGEMMYEKDRTVQSLLPLYFFLIIEPDTERSVHALNLIFKQLTGDLANKENGAYKLNMNNIDAYDQQYGVENLLITMNATLKEGDDEFKWFKEITQTLYQSLAENYFIDPGLWRDVYVPVFTDLVQSEYFDTYCYYISQKRYPKSETWVYAHPKEIDEMFAFLNN